MTKRILFVDDQPEILSGLRRMLHGLRTEWDMHFAESGEEALALMEESPFDVVISDMRMPGMDGATLLTKTRDRYPETVRIILSGQACMESIQRSVKPVHQYLSKPCDADILKDTVSRALSLKEILSQESLVCLASKVTTLPSLPHVYDQLLEELQSEEASIENVAKIVAQDIGMSTKFLQMVNSSFFGSPRRATSAEQAVTYLGLDIIRLLVQSAGIFSPFQEHLLQEYQLCDLMDRRLAVSRLAQQIVINHCDNKKMAEDASLAGMLLDVGRLVLLEYREEEYYKALELSCNNEIPLHEAEIELLGASHDAVGAYLLGLWGMSAPVVEAVGFCHQPSKCSTDIFSPLTAVHVASVLINEGSTPCDTIIDTDYLERLGISDQLPKWQKLAEGHLTVTA